MYLHVVSETDRNRDKPECKTSGWADEGLVFDAYCNGDIVFTKSLVQTLLAVRRLWTPVIAAGARNGVLLVGRRTNVDIEHSTILHDDPSVESMSETGFLFNSDAQDYFIYSRGARNWAMMPEFVVGRPGYDNWLVDDAWRDESMDVIDVTRTLLAVHLTASDGNSAGHREASDKSYNHNIFDPFKQKPVRTDTAHCTTDDARFFTVHDSSCPCSLNRVIRNPGVFHGGKRLPTTDMCTCMKSVHVRQRF